MDGVLCSRAVTTPALWARRDGLLGMDMLWLSGEERVTATPQLEVGGTFLELGACWRRQPTHTPRQGARDQLFLP